jgi:hypothetical protein
LRRPRDARETTLERPPFILPPIQSFPSDSTVSGRNRRLFSTRAVCLRNRFGATGSAPDSEVSTIAPPGGCPSSGGAAARPAAGRVNDRFADNMSSSQESIHSFIIKLWLANQFENKDGRQLSGYIIHVPSGEKRYVHDLKGIVRFIEERIETEKRGLSLVRWLKKKWRSRDLDR